MVSAAIRQAMPWPQDVAVGAFLLTAPKILWYARFIESETADDM